MSGGNDQLLDTLPTWGPEFRVSFELYINSFPDPDDDAEVLRFTASDKNFGSYEDRVPTVFIKKDGHIHVSHLSCYSTWSCPNYVSSVKTWYKIDLLQYLQNNKVSTDLICKHACIKRPLTLILKF